MPFSPCLLDTNCWLYITPASSAPAQILHHIACLDPWNPGYRGRAYVPIPHDTFVFTILFVFQSTPCTSPKKNLFKASQGLLGWIWRVSTWKRVQKRIDWEWSWWPQFQSEGKQFHPSFLLCVSRVSNLGPGPMRYLLTSGIDNLHDRNGKPCQCVSCVGCHASVVAKTRGTSSLYNHICWTKILKCWSWVCENIWFFQYMNTCVRTCWISTHLQSLQYMRRGRQTLYQMSVALVDCLSIYWFKLMRSHHPPATRRPCSFLRRTQHLWQDGGAARIAAVGRNSSQYGLWMAMAAMVRGCNSHHGTGTKDKWENQKYVCFFNSRIKNLFSDLHTRSYTSIWKSRINMRGSTNGGSRIPGWFISWNIPIYKWMIKG
jgi:hypothetical protein